MKSTLYCFLVIFLHILSLVGASSRHFSPSHDDFPLNNQIDTAQISHSLQITQSSNELKGKEKKMVKSGKNKEINKIGSSPPRCEHKCNGCSPCEPIQVPTITGRVGVQYTNYEPEGWKCKCGPAFYSP